MIPSKNIITIPITYEIQIYAVPADSTWNKKANKKCKANTVKTIVQNAFSYDF